MSDCKEDKWLPVRIVAVGILFIVMIFMGINLIADSIKSKNAAHALKADIKARCNPVYNTIDGKLMTTIYSCPAEDGGDDIKYEFTERL